MIQKSELEIVGNNTSAVKAIEGVAQKMSVAEKQIGGFGKGVTGTLGFISGMFGNVQYMAAAAGVGVVAGFGAMIKGSINTADELLKMSQRVGISVESLSTLRHAADLSGISMESFETSVGRLNRNIVDSTLGKGEAKEIFEQLGIVVTDSNGKIKNTDSILFDVANRFSQMEDGTEKAAMSMKLFGRSGSELIPLLNAGSAGIRSMQEEAKALGLEISTNTAKQAEQLNDNITRIESSVTGLATSFVNNFAEPMSDAIDQLRGGLDLIFGNVELIGGIQFKEAEGSAERIAAYRESLLGTTEAYRQIELEILSYQWDEVAAQIASGKLTDEELRKAKLQLQIFREQGEVMAGFGEHQKALANKEHEAALKKQTEELLKLTGEWNNIALKLKRDILTNGLDPVNAKLLDATFYAADLHLKFANVAGAGGLINKHLDAMIDKIIGLQNIGYIQAGVEIPESLGFIDMTPFENYKTNVLTGMSEISDASMINFILMQEGMASSFGSMADTANAFYQLWGEQSGAAFELYKGFSIAQTTIATYQAAVEAYKAMVGIPIVGPGLAVAAAASAVGFGLAKISAISRMSPGASPGVSAGTSSHSAYIPSTQSSVSNTDNRQTQLNITVVGNSKTLDNPDQFARYIAASLERAVKDGALNFVLK